jgi:hydroxylaminobenzene mutase
MKTLILKQKQSNNLIFYGVLLFFLGLLVGLFIPLLANPRMALSSHIEGVLNGMFLIILGLIWSKVELSGTWLKITFWLAIYGTFANWFGILFAAVFNAGKMMTVAAEGKEGSPLEEGIVNFSLLSLSVAMIIICITIMIGLRRNFKKAGANQ